MKILKAFEDFFKDKSEIICLWGGRGSGKSWAAAQKIVMRMLTEEPHRILGIHKFERKIKSTLYQQIVDVIYAEELQDEFIFTVSPLEIKCKLNDNRIMFFGVDGGKIKSITGVTSVLIEEATFLVEEDWKELYLSIRGEHKNYVQFILCYNPIDIRHWINKKFHIDKIYPATLYHSTYLDNPYVGKNYEAKLDANKYDEAYYRMSKFGEWAAISEAIVFRNWNIYDEKLHGEISSNINDYDKITCGLDFGSTHASCALVVAQTDDKLIILDEVYEKGLTNNEFIYQIEKMNYPKNMVYLADSAEPSRIKEFRQNGFNILAVKKGKGSVNYAIDYLKRFNIIVMPKCKNLIREISMYSYLYDEKTDTIFNTPDLKQPDDTIASLRYSINIYLSRKDNKIFAAIAL